MDKQYLPDGKINGANMGPIWGRQDPGGPHVGPMNFAIWVGVATDFWYGYMCDNPIWNNILFFVFTIAKCQQIEALFCNFWRTSKFISYQSTRIKVLAPMLTNAVAGVGKPLLSVDSR